MTDMCCEVPLEYPDSMVVTVKGSGCFSFLRRILKKGGIKMCCESPKGHARHNDGCGCSQPHRFLTEGAQIEKLEEYAKSLEKELSGVKEQIEELKKKT
ncbi:DUF5320 domain-containing protein [candidate division WOR-3 bacterium]|nr:DUF5320 domain-containing protein [candidate division WOR-3 bacterium]